MKFQPDIAPNQKKKVGEENNEPIKETIDGLDEKTKQEVSLWSQQWLEDFYNKSQKPEDDFEERLDFSRIVEGQIAQLVGESDSYGEGFYAPKYMEGVAIFLNNLIDFAKDKSTKTENKETLRNFASNIYESLFYYTGNLTEQVNSAQQLIITAKANRVPEVARYFGQSMVSSVAYNLAWSGKYMAEGIIKEAKNLRLPELLDVIDQLQTVAAVGYAEQPEGVGINALKAASVILKGIEATNSSPLFRYKAELVKRRLNVEKSEPSIGVISRMGTPDKSRLNQSISEEMQKAHTALAGQINPDIYIGGNTFMPIASDAVAVFDHSHTPRELGLVDLPHLPSPQPISIVAVRNILEVLHDPRPLSKRDIENIITFVNEKIFKPLDQHPINTRNQLNREELLQDLTKIDSDLSAQLTAVHFENYNSVSLNAELNPFFVGSEENLSLLLQCLHEPELRKQIEQDLGITLGQIPLRSQIHLLRFLAEQNNEGFERLRNILQKHPDISNKILNAFLACAEDMEYSKYILDVAEKYDSKDLEKILDKYLQITNSTNDIRSFLLEVAKNQAGVSDSEKEGIAELTRKIIHDANLLLQKSSQRSVVGTFRIVFELEIINTNVLFLKSIYQYLHKNFNLRFSDLSSVELISKLGSELNSEERREIENIFIGRRLEDVRYSPLLMEDLVQDLRRALESKENEFYLLNYGKVPFAVIRFEHLSNGDIYVGSLNVRNEIAGSSIGPEFGFQIKTLLEGKFKDKTLRCEVMADKKELVRVYSRFGFKTEGEEEKDGVKYVKMFRPPVSVPLKEGALR